MAFLPTDKELAKLAKRRPRRSRPVKPNRLQESKLRQAMSLLWRDILLPATERIQYLVRSGASIQAITDELERALLLTRTQYAGLAPGIIDMWKAGVNREVQNAIVRSMTSSLGIDLSAVLTQPDVSEAMAAATLRSVQTITSIPSEYLGQIARAVADNFSGVPLSEGRSLLGEIQQLGFTSYRRSKMIARDQTSRLTAALNAHRQQAVGIEMYVWRCVLDMAVVGNPSGVSPVGNKAHGDHWDLEGMYCKWSDNSVYSDDKGQTWKKRPSAWSKLAPGGEILCRCWADPIVDPPKIVQKLITY